MPSQRVAANTTAQTVASEIRNARYKITSLTIDNKAGGGDRQITLRDDFTTSESHSHTSTTNQTINRFTMTALQGDVVTLGEEELKGVRCIGAIKVISDVDDASCYITVGYEID